MLAGASGVAEKTVTKEIKRAGGDLVVGGRKAAGEECQAIGSVQEELAGFGVIRFAVSEKVVEGGGLRDVRCNKEDNSRHTDEVVE